jgi:uncharacterized protein (DUF362 family)/Pyruvate/2-oxoacid:ferredoxin oxidoreductase delta subunit
VTAKSRVLIRRAEYDETLAAAVEEAFDSFHVNVAGRKVLVKPNLLSARSPEKGVTTHPAVITAVIKALEKRKAAQIVVGDNSGMTGYGDNERVAAKTGAMDAARDYYHNLGRNPVRVPLHNPYATEVTISGEVLECDVLVSLPKFKTHTLTMLTGAIKNSYGFLLGAEKARLHRAAKSREAFARTVVDVWALRKPDLVICDAVTAMQGNGPSSRDVFHYGYVLAATDSVALDATIGRIMGLGDDEVLTTLEASRRGLGRSRMDEIDIDGPIARIEGFKLPSTLARGSVFGFLARVAGGLVVSQPRPDTNLCVRCGLCKEHCPTQAIDLTPFPHISHAKCIRCYCCLEFCPYEAMRLSSRVRFIRALAHSGG